MRGHRDLEVVVGASALCAVLAPLTPIEAVSLLFAAPLALFLPGYAISSATFARRTIEPPQFLVLSVGLSLATLALGGLVLNYVPGGIRAASWAVLLLVVVLAGCREAARRRPAALAGRSWRHGWPRLTAASIGFLLGAGLVTAAALALAFTPLPAKHAVGYTELWIQPFDGKGGAGVRVGVGSEEQATHTYTLQLRVSHQNRPFSSQELTLDPGQDRVVEVPTPPATHVWQVRIVATLFRVGLTNVYRRATAWVPGGAPR